MSDQEKTRIYSHVSIGPGTQLNGLYEIEELIAAGGMGEVYRGHEIAGGHKVAIKIVLQELARDETIIQLFNKEASTLRDFYNPAIVRYMAFGTDPVIGRSYMVTEYIDGPSLASVLENGPLDIEQTKKLVGRLASGLDAAHQHGVIHRDMSVDNVLLAGGQVENAKIIDFGIARKQNSKTLLDGKFAGKYNFVSPEQLGMFSGEVTNASDIYSLGLLTVNALRGVPIEMGGTTVQVIEKRRTIPDLSDIDESIRPVIELMLEPDPADRQITMADIAELFLTQKEASKPTRPDLAALKARALPPSTKPENRDDSAIVRPDPLIAPDSASKGGDENTERLPSLAQAADESATEDTSAPPNEVPIENQTERRPASGAASSAQGAPSAQSSVENTATTSTTQKEAALDVQPLPRKAAVETATRTILATSSEGMPKQPAPAPVERIAPAPYDQNASAERTRFIARATDDSATQRIPVAKDENSGLASPETKEKPDKRTGTAMPKADIPAFDNPDAPDLDLLPLSPKKPPTVVAEPGTNSAPDVSDERSSPLRKIAAAALVLAALGAGGAWFVAQQPADTEEQQADTRVALTPGNGTSAVLAPPPSESAVPTQPMEMDTLRTEAQSEAATQPSPPEKPASPEVASAPPQDPVENTRRTPTAAPTQPEGNDVPEITSSPPQDPIEDIQKALTPPSPPKQSDAPEIASLPPQDTVEGTQNNLTAASERVSWVHNYDGGSCFFARTLSAGENSTTIEGMGAATRAFQTMDTQFKEIFGFEPSIELRPIVEPQCAVADALQQLAEDGLPNVRLALDNDRIRSGNPLKGDITGMAKPNMVLYLIDNDGFVYQIDQFLKRTGDKGTFNIKLVELETRDPLPQVVLALSSDKPIRGSGLAEPVLASQLFPKLVEAVKKEGIAVEYAFSYFELGGQ